MKPEYIQHSEIDFIKWDRCIQSCENHLPYGYSWYLNVVSPGWDALVSGDYAKIFPLTFSTKARINYLYQPYFTQQLGLFGASIKDADVTDFLKAIPEKFKFIEINLNSYCHLNAKDFSGKFKITHHLDLTKKHIEIFNSFNDNTKRNIRKAEKLNLIFSDNGKIKSLINLFKETTGNKTELKKKDYLMLESLMKTSISNTSGKIYEVRDAEKNLLAGLFLISSQNILINLFNASSSEGKKKSAMFYLVNEIIKLNAQSNKTLDFEGSEIAEVARFYKGFGGVPIQYPHIKLNRLPWPLKWIKE